jgi:hypothetical protein
MPEMPAVLQPRLGFRRRPSLDPADWYNTSAVGGTGQPFGFELQSRLPGWPDGFPVVVDTQLGEGRAHKVGMGACLGAWRDCCFDVSLCGFA